MALTGLSQAALPSDGLVRLAHGTQRMLRSWVGDVIDLNFSVVFLLFLDLEDRWTAGLDWASPEDLNSVWASL